jgi:Zn-dependent M28 family amino/carboxypeptidase
MFFRLFRGAALLLLLVAAPAAAQSDPPVTPADLRRHIEVLASDAFEGRAPATEGETRTINYIAEQLRARGLEPAVEGGSWFQPVGIVIRQARSHDVRWSANGRALAFDQNEIVLQGREAQARLADAPVVFVGHGVRLPERGVDQLAGTDLRGAVAVMLLDGPDVPGFPSFTRRLRMVTEAGATAVIALTGADLNWDLVTRNYRQPTTRLASQVIAPVIGAMPLASAQRLIGAAGGDLERLLNDQPGSSFRAVTLPIRATIDVATEVRPYTTNNVVGRIRGSGSSGESVLYLGHWDHLGLCRPEGEPDRICNGAVDNASGIAMLIEIAGRLARQPRPVRDVLILATTSEEIGLFGAEQFARTPVVPLSSIVAAINLDTVAIHPAGQPVAVIGRGVAPLDAAIDATVAAMGRRLDTDEEANAFAQRQDGWALSRAGVPAVMLGGSFSDMAMLNRFLEGAYHSPDDEVGPGLLLDGAAEDATLLVALGRRLADPAQYRRPARAPGPAGQEGRP